jgi:hypothetical protein
MPVQLLRPIRAFAAWDFWTVMSDIAVVAEARCVKIRRHYLQGLLPEAGAASTPR